MNQSGPSEYDRWVAANAKIEPKAQYATRWRKVDPERVARLRGQGFSRTEIARLLGCSTRTVSNSLKQPGMRELAEATLAETAPEPGAVETLRKLLVSEREEIRLRAAVALLAEKVPDAASAATPAGSGITVPLKPVLGR